MVIHYWARGRLQQYGDMLLGERTGRLQKYGDMLLGERTGRLQSMYWARGRGGYRIVIHYWARGRLQEYGDTLLGERTVKEVW